MDTQYALSRRGALVRLGAGGLGLALATRGIAAGAQESTPLATPGAVPAALEGWVAGWNAASPDQIADAYASDAVIEVVPFNTTLRGQDQIRQYFTGYFGAFSEAVPRMVSVFATADRAAAEWTFQGRYTGQFPGLPAGSGQPVSLRGANILTLSNGQIVEEHIYTDLAALLGQLGLGPAPGTPAAVGAATPA